MKSTRFHMKYTVYLAFSGRGVLGEIHQISWSWNPLDKIPNEPRTNGPIFVILTMGEKFEGIVLNLTNLNLQRYQICPKIIYQFLELSWPHHKYTHQKYQMNIRMNSPPMIGMIVGSMYHTREGGTNTMYDEDYWYSPRSRNYTWLMWVVQNPCYRILCLSLRHDSCSYAMQW